MLLSNLARFSESRSWSTKNMNDAISDFIYTQDTIDIDAVKILSMEFPENNIAQKKAVIWMANILEVHVEEIENSLEIFGDLGDAIMHFTQWENTESDITLQEFITLQSLDCSNMTKLDGTNYDRIKSAFTERGMSGLEAKWFVRYWLRTPRNSVGASSVRNALAYSNKEFKVKEWANLHSNSHIALCLNSGIRPLMKLHFGQTIKPMLAKPLRDKIPFKNYLIDVKYDGNRYIVHRHDGNFMIFNRSGKVIDNSKFSDVLEELKYPEANYIVDMEIYPVDSQGRPKEHQAMGTRVHSKNHELAIQNCPVRFAIFDVLMWNDEPTYESNYSERIELLHSMFDEKQVATTLGSDIEAAYNIAINDGYEGIMIKNLDAPYDFKRSSNLLKHKPARINLDVVVSSAEYGNGRKSDWFSTFGICVACPEKRFVSVGNVGTGFSDAQLQHLTTELRKITERHDKGTWHVLPRIVLEVTADAVTQDKDGNIGLRFPRLEKIRDDKFAVDIDNIDTVMQYLH